MKPISLVFASALFGSVAILAGCGGNGAGNSSATAGTSADYGTFNFSSVSPVTAPIISGGNGTTIYGFAGSTFTKVIVNYSGTAVTNAPATNKIVFLRSGQIWLMNSDGTGAVQINSSTTNHSPSLSPDGTKIAYVQGSDLNIHVMNVDGTGDAAITRLADATHTWPHWSTDGTKLVFSDKVANGTYDVFTITPVGGGRTDIGTINSTEECDPDFSPTGAIAFHSNSIWVPGLGSEQGVMTMNGTGTVSTFVGHSDPMASIHWSPDGTKITYMYGGNIMTAKPDGTDVITVNSNPGVGHPSWSGDSLKLAYDLNGQIYTMGADGSSQTSITSAAGITNAAPDWSRLSVTTKLARPAAASSTTYIGGASAPFGPSAAGFMISQIDKTTPCVLAFDTVDTTAAGRDATSIAPLPTGDTRPTNLFFTIQSTGAGASAIKWIKYQNGSKSIETVNPYYNGAVTNVLASFSATDGTLVTLVTYVGSRSTTSKVAATKQGNIVKVTGTASAIYDAQGRNLAPAGASEISYDATTGKLLNWK